MNRLSQTVAACLFLISLPAAAMIITPAVEEIARQAPFIVKGTLLPDLRLQIEHQYKGEIPEETISIPDLAPLNDVVNGQWEDTTYRVRALRVRLEQPAYDQLKGNGLIGHTLVVFLEKADEGDTYNLKGSKRFPPEPNRKHAAVKMISGNAVLGFFQIRSDGPLRLVLDRNTPTPEALEAAIRYDRPLRLTLGHSSPRQKGVVINRFYFTLINLSDELVPLDLPENMTLTIKGHAFEEETELPDDLWDRRDFRDILEPGRMIYTHYVLSELDPEAFPLEKGKAYEGTLTIRTIRDGEEETYSATTEAKIR